MGELELKGQATSLERRKLTAPEFRALAEVPPEVEWFANLRNGHTRRAYQADVEDFMRFVGIETPREFRLVTRAHVIAWRDELTRRGQERVLEPELAAPLSAATVRRKLSALSSLFQYLCNSNAVTHNPVKGVSRPSEGSNEARPRRWATPRRGDYLGHPTRKTSRASGTGLYSRFCSSTPSAEKRWLA